MPKLLFYILLISTYSQQLTAQSVDDSIGNSLSNIVDLYYDGLGEQSPLYNGSEYIEYAFTLQEGHPFLGSYAYVNGTIHFDGMIFHNVPILYDIIKDQVVIQDFQKLNKINLRADKIQQFTLSDRIFIRIIHDSSNQIKTGFYDQLYNRKTGLFVKREKKIIVKYVDPGINNVVVSQNIYYIKKEGIYYAVKNKAALLDILKSKGKEIKQYFKNNKIKFKNDPEKALRMAVEYYDQLTN